VIAGADDRQSGAPELGASGRREFGRLIAGTLTSLGGVCLPERSLDAYAVGSDAPSQLPNNAGHRFDPSRCGALELRLSGHVGRIVARGDGIAPDWRLPGGARTAAFGKTLKSQGSAKMKAGLCLGVVVGMLAIGGLSSANATAVGTGVGASRPALAVGIVEKARWWHCKWRHHRRHCWH
jgi:hypothetical protein